MSLIRGVLLAGKFRTHHELNSMSHEDQRNTLIVELSNRSNQKNFQAFNDAALADAGAALVFLRTARIRDDAQLKTISIDDMRNILIVEIGAMTGMGQELQGLSNIDLVALGLGKFDTRISLQQNTFLRGVLLAGQFRTQHELNTMSDEDERNTLIVELSGRSNQHNFQAFNSFELAGMGAVLVFLRAARIRDDAQLKTITIDDMRNILIVEIDGQTHLGSRLQSLSNIDLVLTGLGIDPVFPVVKPVPFVFSIDSIEVRKQKADKKHSDSDWLSIIVSIGNPVNKSVKNFTKDPFNIAGNAKSGGVFPGDRTDPFIARDSDIVTITYLLMNLGSSDSEKQFAEAVKVTNKVLDIAGPVIGAAIGLFFGAPSEGFAIGKQVSGAFDQGIKVAGEIFDFFGVHIGPPNCNGEVLHDTLVFQPGELARAVGQPGFRDYTGPQANERCGGAPQTRVNFSVMRAPSGLGSVPPNQ